MASTNDPTDHLWLPQLVLLTVPLRPLSGPVVAGWPTALYHMQYIAFQQAECFKVLMQINK